jgi:hypothetical protein
MPTCPTREQKIGNFAYEKMNIVRSMRICVVKLTALNNFFENSPLQIACSYVASLLAVTKWWLLMKFETDA